MSSREMARRKRLWIGVSAGSGGGIVTAGWVFAYLLVLHHLVPGLMEVAILILCVALVRHCTRRLHTLASKPRPDYSLIASMERPIWGEAFEHAGAPGASASYVPMTGGTTSELIRLPARNAQGGAVGCDHERSIELRSHIGRVGWICGACGERLSHYPHHP